MATLKKTRKIKKIQTESAHQQPDNDTNTQPLNHSGHSLEKPQRHIKNDPRKISNLTEEERLKIKSEYPEMNEYFCMSSTQKFFYFIQLNLKYMKDIKLSKPPGYARKKKSIRFKARFQIKPFGYLQTCEAIKMRKSFMELYRAKDNSKFKPISKFPKKS